MAKIISWSLFRGMEFPPSSLPFPRIDLHNEKLHNSFSPLNAKREKKSRRWGGRVYNMWGEEKYTQNFRTGKSEHNVPRVRSWRRCEDNIKMNHTVCKCRLDSRSSGYGCRWLRRNTVIRIWISQTGLNFLISY